MPKCDLQSNFIEIALRHGCSPVNLLHIFRTPFPKNTSGRLLLHLQFLILALKSLKGVVSLLSTCRFAQGGGSP